MGKSTVLTHGAQGVPLGALGSAAIAGVLGNVEVVAEAGQEVCSVVQAGGGGGNLRGHATAARFFARLVPSAGLFPADAFAQASVEQWVDYTVGEGGAFGVALNGAAFDDHIKFVDGFLATRTYLVGHSLTLADVCLWGVLAPSVRYDKMSRSWAGKNLMPHLRRWFGLCMSEPHLAALHNQYCVKRTRLGEERNFAAGAKSQGSFDIELPGAEMGKVCTRFPPEPSGYLHLGHVKAALTNNYFARMYKGTLILRFDDTNPSKEKDDFVQNIMEDVATLGIKPDKVTYTSDSFPQLLAMAEKLISEGKAYVDDTPIDQMREERMARIESARRNTPPEEALKMWKEMVKGSEKGNSYCLRIKMDMKDNNATLRDPVIYRCNADKHHRTKDKYKLYPTYDFACPLVDAWEGVTHALRTTEYNDREAQYDWVQKLCGVRKVHLWTFSRLAFEYTILSKRQLQWFVDSKMVEDWSDPRFPTVQGIMRRGLTLKALQDFILSQGASKNNNLMEWSKLWSMNSKVIDPTSGRHVCIVQDGMVRMTLTNYKNEYTGTDEVCMKSAPRHKKNPDLGIKIMWFNKEILVEQVDAAVMVEGEEITLCDWGNAIIRKKVMSEDGSKIESIEAELHLEGDVKKTKLKCTWLSDLSPADIVTANLVEYGYLITKAKPEEEDKIEEIANKESKKIVLAKGDANLRACQKGDIIQLERKGFYYVERPWLKSSGIWLTKIPDQKSGK